MTMPAQKPGRSEQSVGTPTVFLDAALKRLGALRWAIDLAADHTNYVTEPYFTKEVDSLVQPWHRYCNGLKGWGWLNPEFSDIYPWAEKCWQESRLGAQVALLVPAATDTLWWHDYVRGHGYATHLRQRIKFNGHSDLYPKGLALVLYAPYIEGGDCWWNWNPAKRLKKAA